MIIIIDTREKERAIQKIVDTFQQRQVDYIRSKLYIGDYQRFDNPYLVVDRKQSLLELTVNVGQDHKRFAAELKRAQELGVHMVILCEHSSNVKTIEDVQHWENPRLKESPLAISGPRLYKILLVMQEHYGCEFQFCSKAETGRRILEILGGAP